MVVSLAAQALIYGPGMFGEGVNYQGVLVKYEAAAWINHFAGSFLLPTFLFPTGALIGDYMEGRVSEKMAAAILGIVSALVAAFGSIIAALLG